MSELADVVVGAVNERRCRCRPDVMRGDCPMSYANAAHERGDTYGKTLAEFMGSQREVDMQEGTLTRLLEMAERGRAEVAAAAAAPRSAAEIAREMVSDPNPTWHWARILGAEFSSATPDGIETVRRNVVLLITQARADGAAAALAGQQPRDLAGRIRALIQEYAGRWADAEPRSIERRAATGVMDDLCRALDDVRTGTGRPLTWWIELFRHPSGSMDPTIRAHRSRAADELEAIVRERAPSEGT